MSNIIKIAVCFFLYALSFSSCEKQKENPDKASAKLNGIDLDFTVGAKVSGQKFSFSFDYVTDEKITRLDALIKQLPLDTGSFTISTWKSFMNVDIPQGVLYTMEDDLALDDYSILEGATNTVTIKEHDAGEQYVSGTFDLTFVIDTMYTYKKDGFPDTIYLRNGVFQVHYEK